MAMSARGKSIDTATTPEGEGASVLERMSCPMCRHALTWSPGDAPPRRCPACRGWLAAATFRLRQTEVDSSLALASPHDRDTVPDADATPSGWKRIPRASIFQRFGQVDAVEEDASDIDETSMPGSEVGSQGATFVRREPAEKVSLQGERRSVKFAFEPPPQTDRFRKRREVEASSLPESIATTEHADLTDDDAIEAWLDLVESEIEESEPLIDPQSTHSADVAFELVEDAPDVPRHDVVQGATPPGHVIVEEAGATTILMSEIIEEMHQTELLGSLLDAPEEEVEDEEGEEEELFDHGSKVEEEEHFSQTLMMFGEQPIEQTGEQARSASPLPTTAMRENTELVVEEDEPEPLEHGGAIDSEDVDEVSDVKEDFVDVSVDAVDAPVIDEPVAVIQRASMPPARWRFVRRALGVVALLCVFCLGIFAGMSWVQMKHSADPGEQALADSPRAVLENMIMLPRERASRNAVGTARTMVGLSLSQDYMARQQQVALELLDAGELDRALKVLGVMWEKHTLRTVELGERYASAARSQGRYKLARQVAVQTYLLTDPSRDAASREALQQLFNQAIEQDASLHPEVVEIKKDVQVDVIRALGGGKSISLKFKKGDETTHAFKPSQLDWAEGWRAEVASYLFCEAVGCHFKVPKSEPVKISKEDFLELYGRFNSTRQTEYARIFETNLLWVKEPGEDGVEREYLYGVLKEWMPGFVDYPIEYTDIWDDWLDATKPDDWARRDLSDALRVLRFRQDGRFFQNIMSERREASTYEVARGLSDIQLFDFVTSNWDRYSGVETYYGVNNQFDDGQFLSLDNGAAFHILTQRKVEQHFDPVTRFSKSTIAALEMLQPGILDEVLFPEASTEAKQRLDVFWTQRERALARVASLSKKHGKSAVLYFD